MTRTQAITHLMRLGILTSESTGPNAERVIATLMAPKGMTRAEAVAYLVSVGILRAADAVSDAERVGRECPLFHREIERAILGLMAVENVS